MHKTSFLCFLALSTGLTLTLNSSPAQAVHIVAASAPDTVKKDSTKPVPRSVIKPYWQVVTPHYSTHSGLFTVHEYKDTVYFEIPDSILGRDIEVINRLGAGPGGTGIYAGEVLDEKTIQFERNAADSTIRIRYDLVDLEEIRDMAIEDFKPQFTDIEWLAIQKSEEPLRAFYHFWTAKESILKADGRGLNLPLADLTIDNSQEIVLYGCRWSIKNIPFFINYACHVAHEGAGMDCEMIQCSIYG